MDDGDAPAKAGPVGRAIGTGRRCRVASKGKFYDIGPGDCLATGMGWHHDVLNVIGDGAVEGAYFEGSLEGQKRPGHLWEPHHGKAVPCTDRV